MSSEGLTIVVSAANFSDTLARLESALRTRAIAVFARIDHAAGAAVAGLLLRPTTLVIFGNAKVGTALMQSAQSIGIDLPMRVLVWEDEAGKTSIGYTEPSRLAERYGADPSLSQIALMGQLLRAVAEEAARA